MDSGCRAYFVPLPRRRSRSIFLIDRTLLRALAVSTVLAAGLALGGCNSDQLALATNAKANKPVPEKLVNDMTAKDIDLQSPMLVRLFKQEAELEVWKQDRSGKFALLKTYPICRWSGDLGPKLREGDRQAPEGFYSITPGQMNPQSAFYLSFNMGYPNAFDKALGRSGSQLMVHGDCSSRGCYAMTDEQISEIYALGREAFFGGQRAFQVQAYPFRMTPTNMAKHRNNPNMPFWKMIKEGNDHFEVTKQEPKVEFCESKYVFNPDQPANGRPLNFTAGQKCPAYSVPTDIAEAVLEKRQQDDLRTSELISKGVPVAARRPDIDGGMHRIFASKLPEASTGLSDSEAGIQTSAFTRAPGTIPATVNPPKSAASDDGLMSVAAVTPVSTPGPKSSETGGGFFNSLAKKVGLGGSDTAKPAAAEKPKLAAPAKPPAPVAKPVEVRQAGKPVSKPSLASDTPSKPETPPTTVAGTAAANPSFESRFSAFQ